MIARRLFLVPSHQEKNRNPREQYNWSADNGPMLEVDLHVTPRLIQVGSNAPDRHLSLSLSSRPRTHSLRKTAYKIRKDDLAKDQIDRLIAIPPRVTIIRLMQWLKGKTARHLSAEYSRLKKRFWAGICGREGIFAVVPEM